MFIRADSKALSSPYACNGHRLTQNTATPCRFEMPFNVWCAGCNHLIGKGVRFNAEKQEIGKYHSTKIWSFVMRAPCCQQRIEVQTDPKNAEYKVVSGGRVKVSNGCALLGWGSVDGGL